MNRRFILSSLAALALATPVVARLAVADPPATALASSATAITAPGPRGGIRYDSMAPLDAVVTPKFDPNSPPPLALTYSVHYKGGEGATVPALFTVPTATKGSKVPCVIVLHGLGQRKEDVYLLSAAFAKHGYAAFFIDAAGHGERVPPGGKTIGQLSLPEFRRAMGQTVADLRRGVDFLSTRPEVDSARIGFLGASLGGIVGGVFVGDEPRIKAAALWAAGGDWEKLIGLSHHRFAERYRQGADAVPAPEIGRTLTDVDPLNTIAQCSPRPLLMINGDKDDIVPVVCANELYAAAREPKERIVLPGGHVPEVATMLTDTMEWLDKNLKQ